LAFLHSFIDRIMKSITHFFSPRQADPDPAMEEFTFDREPFETPQANTKRKQTRDRKGRALIRKNLADLLDNLDVTFEAMKLPTDKLSWLPKGTVIGLKRLGVYVPDKPWKRELVVHTAGIYADPAGPMPAMMAISFSVSPDNCTHPNDDDLVFPNTMFAVKHAKVPPLYTQLPGIVYEFGYSYNFSSASNFWIQCFLVIDPATGEIKVCDELRGERVTIPVKRNRKGEGAATRSFMQTRWREPYITKSQEVSTLEERRQSIAHSFVQMLAWWNERDLRWSVGIRKGKNRVVFSVDPENTKTYFADRDKSIKAADGKAKKIIHYVRAHERVRDGKTISVKEHIRGIREFDWGSHHCIVTAPKFHRTILTSHFEVPAQDEDDLLMLTEAKIADLPRAAAMLADMEEMDLRKRA
jgi:hypothetical protein